MSQTVFAVGVHALTVWCGQTAQAVQPSTEAVVSLLYMLMGHGSQVPSLVHVSVLTSGFGSGQLQP